MQSLELQVFSYEERRRILPALTTGFSECGGWVLDRRTIAPDLLELRVEIPLLRIPELYACLVAAGLDLARPAHRILTDLCNCRRHLHSPSQQAQIVNVRMRITFLKDMTLHSLLSTTVAPA